MKNQRIILRRCISCREIFDRNNLLKITKDNNSGLLINAGTGRSAYLCKTRKCTRDPKVKKSLQRSLRTSFDQFFYEVFKIETQNYE